MINPHSDIPDFMQLRPWYLFLRWLYHVGSYMTPWGGCRAKRPVIDGDDSDAFQWHGRL